MPTLSKDERIQLFMTLFKGRGDVFAQRWENGGRGGYFPVYADKAKKQYAPLTDSVIEQHLMGNRTVGVYPLLPDNTSWFVVADFDGETWLDSARRFLEQAGRYSLQGYLERSRSGNGGHVWFFFSAPCPASKSRKVFLHIIKESNNVGMFDKEESFDRLFPNQDYLSGKGFGNLIALPLQGVPRKSGNSVFLDPNMDFGPVADQWEFLNSVERISTEKLDELFSKLADQKTLQPPNQTTIKDRSQVYDNSLPITISNFISIPKHLVSKNLANFLTDNLNFYNSAYAVKEKMGLSNYKTPKYFKLVQEEGENVLIPRGFLQHLVRFLDENHFVFTIIEKRQKLEEVDFTTSFTLMPYQRDTVEKFQAVDQGILVAPPGSGKTIMGLALIAQKKQPALIIVHRDPIYRQWLERIEQFMGIPKPKIGQINAIKKEPQSPVTVAMIHTLNRMKPEDLERFSKKFGLLLIDECHHIPAEMYRNVVTKFNPHYLFGLTATPTRKHNDAKMIPIYLGEIIHEVPTNYQKESEEGKQIHQETQINLMIRETNLSFPFPVKTRSFQLVSKVLIFDSHRNQQIVGDIADETKVGKKCLVLTERKDHVNTLAYYLNKEFEVLTMVGTTSQKQKKVQTQQLKSGQFQIVIATGQLLGEGASFDCFDCLFLVFPFTYQGKLVQYIGRIMHGKNPIKTVYDYRDINVDYLERMFKRRKKYYDKYFADTVKLETIEGEGR